MLKTLKQKLEKSYPLDALGDELLDAYGITI